MGIGGIRNFANGIVKPLVKRLKNGNQVLTMEKNGKTITQVLDRYDQPIGTRIKEIYSSPTRTSVKKIHIADDKEKIINNITLKNADGTKTKLSIVEEPYTDEFNDLFKMKSFYTGHTKTSDLYKEYDKSNLPARNLKDISITEYGIKEYYSYSSAYGKQNCANIFPQRGGIGEANTVYFDAHGVPTWPQMNLEGLEKYL